MELDFDMKAYFKELTGLDYDIHTDEEYNEWYHNQSIKIARESPYDKEILKMAERIIEKKDYSLLMHILENYDELVKKSSSLENTKELPYWCYGLIDRR